LFVAILAVTLPLPLDEGELDPSGSGIELDEGESGDDEGPGEANSGTDSDRSEFKPGGSDGESEVSDEESGRRSATRSTWLPIAIAAAATAIVTGTADTSMWHCYAHSCLRQVMCVS